MANGELVRTFEIPDQSGADIRALDVLYFFRDENDYAPNPDGYLYQACPLHAASAILLYIRQLPERVSVTRGYADLLASFPYEDIDNLRTDFTVDEFALYATEHRVYHFSSFLPGGDNANYSEQTPHPLDEPLEFSLVPLDDLGKKVYLLVAYGTDESEHYLLLDPVTGETLISTP